MDLAQVKRLKLNARNIQSTLISYNKSLRKLRVDETSFFKRQEINQKRSEKEEKIEKPSKIESSIEFLKSKVASGPMGIFDKIKEFFGLVLMGLLVNNLPRIIKGLQKFFGDNPWIISGLKQILSFVGTGLSNLIQLVGSFSNASYAKTEKERTQIEVIINKLDSLLTGIENSIIGMILNANTPTPTPTVNSPNYSSFVAGGGKAAVQKGRTVQQVVKQGQKNISRYNSGPRAPTPAPAVPSPLMPPAVPIQSFAKGGTVQPTSGRRVSSKSRSPFSKPGGTAQGRKAIKSTKAFDQFNTNTILENSRIKDQENNNNLFEDLIKKFRELKTLKDDEKKDDTPPPLSPIEPGGSAVSGGSSDFWLLSLISLYENANPQGAADVAQSIYNRMANRGQSARQVILSENQYQPVRKFGGYTAWGQVVDKESALAHIKKYPGNSASAKGLDAVAKALLDPSKQADAAKFVGVRPDFRNEGYESSNDEMTDDKSRLNHTFGFNRGGSKGKITKPAAIPSFVDADVISENTPTQLKGKNTAYQGSTGRSTGEHFHIGPSELLNEKTLRAENVGTTQGLVDSRQAAFRVAKALIARKEKFIFSNSGVEIDPSKRITDQQLRNYILQEQNAHMSRSMGSSWGGVDIAAYKSGMDVPIPVGKVVYHDDGFGFRARLIGTKGFVGHLTKGSKATPLDKIEKAKPVTTTQEPVITPEKQKQLTEQIKKSKPGSGERIRIPGVGTYVRGTEGFGPFSKSVDKYFDENGDPLTKDEFYKRWNKIKSGDLVSSSISSLEVKSLKRGNLELNTDEERSSTVVIAQQQVIVPGPVVPMPYAVPQKSSSSSQSVAFSQESLAARSLV